MTCARRFDVGVYVLGAMDPAERPSFEQHLESCDECGTEMRRLGGLPGLLARVPEPGTGPAEGTGPVPDGLLARATARARRARRARMLVAAAAVVVALAGGVLIGRSLPTTAGAVRTVELQSVLDAPVRGEAGLAARPWGTAISLRCRSVDGGEHTGPEYGGEVYVLVVRAPDGSLQEIARWSPPPGQDVDVQAATNLPPAAVSGLQVRTSTGQVVLQG